ncbi:MAG: hypothetical protein KJP07_23320 [Desulfatitalea sp.]|nr:hypothetical protein [Desulfatitalea sp.]
MNKTEIVDILKDEGLDVAEEMAVNATRATIKLLRVVLPKVSAGFGLAFGMFMDVYEKKIYAMLDAIDGEDDPEY